MAKVAGMYASLLIWVLVSILIFQHAATSSPLPVSGALTNGFVDFTPACIMYSSEDASVFLGRAHFVSLASEGYSRD